MRRVGLKRMLMGIGVISLLGTLPGQANANVSSAIKVAGNRADCEGTFVFSGTKHDVMVLPATCLQNTDSGGLKVISRTGESTRSLKAVVHPVLIQRKIYDLTKAPQSFDFAVALFPKGTASAITPIARDFVGSFEGFVTQSGSKSTFFPNFRPVDPKDAVAVESVTDLQPDTSVMPGSAIYDGMSRGLVAVGLGCAKDAKGNANCTAVSLHDSLSRDVLIEAKRQFPDSLAALEVPTKVHQLGHLGIFRRRCAPACQPVYCRPAAQAPQYNNSCNRTMTYSPSNQNSQSTSAYVRGVEANNSSTFSPSNTNTNTNTVSPQITFSPNINVHVNNPATATATVTPSAASSSSSTYRSIESSGHTPSSHSSSVTPVSYTPTTYTAPVVDDSAQRYAYEEADRIRRDAQSQAESVRAAASQSRVQAESAARAAQAELEQASAARQAQERQSAEWERQRAAQQEEIRITREEVRQLNARLTAQIAELAEARRKSEVDRQTDWAKQLKQDIDPEQINGITGEETVAREKVASEAYATVYSRPSTLDASQRRRDFGVEAIAARESKDLKVDGAVSGNIPTPSLLASNNPFKTPAERSQTGGITALAMRQLEAGQRGNAMDVADRGRLVVRAESPFLGPTGAPATRSIVDAQGQPMLAMYLPN